MNEIIICTYCGKEFELYYGGKMAEDDEVTSQTSCKCRKKIVQDEKILDRAFTILKQQGILK